MSPGCRPRSALTASGTDRTPSTGGRATAGQSRCGDSRASTKIKIAAFVEEGLSSPEFAARLLLSRPIVAIHVSRILNKLDVNSRIEVARESTLRGLSNPSSGGHTQQSLPRPNGMICAWPAARFPTK
jgi:DNA-binding NarL/FixJ family response regulator